LTAANLSAARPWAAAENGRGEDDREGTAHQWRPSPPGVCPRRSIQKGSPIGVSPANTFCAPQGSREPKAAFDLSGRAGATIFSRLEISGERSAGAVATARQKMAGGRARSASSRESTNETAQAATGISTFLSPTRAALAPFADVRAGRYPAARPQQAITQFSSTRSCLNDRASSRMSATLSPRDSRASGPRGSTKAGWLVRFRRPPFWRKADDEPGCRLKAGARGGAQSSGGQVSPGEKPASNLASFHRPTGPFAGSCPCRRTSPSTPAGARRAGNAVAGDEKAGPRWRMERRW